MLYKIKLTPLERFFFGGENVFGAEEGQDERRRSYLVQSNLLPQQTTLLGMLREQLLTQNGRLIRPDSTAQHRQEAAALVGETGFDPQHAGGYGLVRGLSPVVLEDENGQLWQPAPLDDGEGFTTRLDDGSGRLYLDGYNPKEGLELQFSNPAGETRSLEACFQAFEQVGIRMTNRVQHANYGPDDRKDAYYYQTFRGNGVSAFTGATGSFHFVFWADLDPAIGQHTLSDATVFMGGERSAFRMTVSAAGEGTLQGFLSGRASRHNHPDAGLLERYPRLVLLSDASADWALLRQHSAFAVTQTVPFRFFTTSLKNTTRFYDFKKNRPDGRAQSRRHTLLRRGSVLYARGVEGLSAIRTHLDAQKAFHTIGYNYYQTN